MDNILLLPALAAIAIRLIPPDIFTESRLESEGLWAGGKPKKWFYATPIVLLWVLIVYLIVIYLNQPSLHGKI